jgi:short-subunit dehydrogenase involved in D-alanine esterification of teichoic acids
VKVIELIPPYVATELGGPRKAATLGAGPQPMPLDAFIAETMKELESDGEELAIGEAKRLVAAAGLETAKKVFAAMNP